MHCGNVFINSFQSPVKSHEALDRPRLHTLIIAPQQNTPINYTTKNANHGPDSENLQLRDSSDHSLLQIPGKSETKILV